MYSAIAIASPLALTKAGIRSMLDVSMKTDMRRSRRKPTEKARPHMTREIAEERAISGGKGKFDGAAFLRTLKK